MSKPEVTDAAPTMPGRDGQAPSAVPAAPVVNARDLMEGFRLELPRGGWVQFGSVLDVSYSVRKRIVDDVRQLNRRVQSGKATNQDYADVADAVNTRILRAVVEAWSYDVPLPVPKDALGRLPAIVVDELTVVANEYMKRLVLLARRQPGLGDRRRSWLPSLPQPFRRHAALAVAAAFAAWQLLTVFHVVR
jgi:hypothetical protein